MATLIYILYICYGSIIFWVWFIWVSVLGLKILKDPINCIIVNPLLETKTTELLSLKPGLYLSYLFYVFCSGLLLMEIIDSNLVRWMTYHIGFGIRIFDPLFFNCMTWSYAVFKCLSRYVIEPLLDSWY